VSKKDNLINLKKSYPMDTLHTYYGDSTADLIAAKEAGYNFVGILGYSMVAGELKTQCLAENYQFINVFTDLL
jgi:phosphoglycolate phosphatase-like HAD superfamily hydrolase